MNLDELTWFIAVAETGHVTEAAAELGLSQPTLSRALTRLEREVGTPLFNRVNRRLVLNPHGQIMLEHARRSVAEMKVATDRISAERDPDSGIVRLAFLHSAAAWFVPDLLRRFHATFPHVRFDLYEGAAHEVADYFARGQADLAITSGAPTETDAGWKELYVERLCLTVPKTHPLAGRSRISLAEAADEPFVALRTEFALRHTTDQLWAEAGVTPRIVFEAMEIPAVEGLVAAALGVAVLPLPRPEQGERTCVYIPLSSPFARRSVGLVWPTQREISPAASRFATFARQ